MALPDVENLELEPDGGWLTIWFNRPDNHNALSEGLITDLIAVLDADPRRSHRSAGSHCAGAAASFVPAAI